MSNGQLTAGRITGYKDVCMDAASTSLLQVVVLLMQQLLTWFWRRSLVLTYHHGLLHDLQGTTPNYCVASKTQG